MKYLATYNTSDFNSAFEANEQRGIYELMPFDHADIPTNLLNQHVSTARNGMKAKSFDDEMAFIVTKNDTPTHIQEGKEWKPIFDQSKIDQNDLEYLSVHIQNMTLSETTVKGEYLLTIETRDSCHPMTHTVSMGDLGDTNIDDKYFEYKITDNLDIEIYNQLEANEEITTNTDFDFSYCLDIIPLKDQLKIELRKVRDLLDGLSTEEGDNIDTAEDCIHRMLALLK